MVAPDVPDFTGRDGDVDRLLDLLDEPDQAMHVVLGNRPFHRFAALVLRLAFRIVKPIRLLTQDARRFLADEARNFPEIPLALFSGLLDLGGLGRRSEILDRDLLAAEDGF